jgi:probable HAF family extracellular repeat protein
MKLPFRSILRSLAAAAVLISIMAPWTSARAQILAPSSVAIAEDSAGRVDFKVANPLIYRNVTVNNLSPGLLSGVSLNFLGNTGIEANYRINLTPVANASGDATIHIQARDNFLFSSAASIVVRILPANDAPTASLASLTTSEDVPASGTATIADVDNPASSASFAVVSSSNPSLAPIQNVTISGSGASRTVTVRPMPNRNGSAVLTFRTFETATPAVQSTLDVNLTVNAVNDPPVAGPVSALDLPGGDGSVRITDSGIPAQTPDALHAIETWVRPTSITAGRQWLLQLGYGGTGSHHWLLTPGASPGNVTLSAGVWNGPQVSVQLPADAWTHVATTYDGDIYEIFLNGIRAGSVAVSEFTLSTSPSIPAQLSLGHRWIGAESNFRGQIDEFRLWNRPLTAREILSRFRVPRVGDSAVDPSANDLLVYWRFDESEGLTAFDSAPSGGRQDGALLSGAAWIGPIRRDYFDGIPNHLIATLYADPRFPASPTSVTYLPNGFETPPNSGEFYGQRVSGWLVPPETGNYTFYIASDDQSELLLSSDDQPGNKQRIARVDFWTDFRSWTQFGTQRSAPIALEAGKRYYLEANMVEAGGLDNLSVRWDLPDGSSEAPIPAFRFIAHDHFGTWNVAEDEPTRIYLTANDFEVLQTEAGATLDFSIVQGPQHGTLDPPTGGRWTNPLQNPILYTPSLDYNGPDSFTFTVRDQNGLVSLPARVLLNVIGANDLPDISPVADLTILEGDTSGAIPFTLSDSDNPPSSVIVTVESSDTSLVPLDRIKLGGTGANRTIEIRPAPGELGTLTITLTAFDGDIDGRTKQEVFKVRVDPQPAYALIDLGDLGQRNQSFGRSVNDSGWASAFAQSQAGDARAGLFRGLASTMQLENLTPSGVSLSRALGINSQNAVVGMLLPDANSPSEGFVWRNDSLTSLRTVLSPGVHSIASAINDNGDIVGSLRIGSEPRKAFLLLDIGTKTNIAGFGGTNAAGEAINNRAAIAGWATDASNKPHSFTFSLASGLFQIPELPNHDAGHAYGINDDGLVVGDSFLNSDPQGTVRAFLREGGSTLDLGTLPGGTNTIAYAINNFRQIVGEANDDLGRRRAFLRTAERNFDLNALIHDSRTLTFDSGAWSLEEARSVSRNGTIVGVGRNGGRFRGFMAVPAWVIGRQIARPENTVARQPEIELIDAGPEDNRENSFYWSTRESKLYPIRPVTARIKWFQSFRDVLGSGTNITVNTDRVEVVGVSVWPKDPQVHIALAPVEIEPAAAPEFRYGFQNVLFHTGTTPTVDPTTKTFNKTDRGYSVLYYLETGNILPRTPNPATQRPYFEVVRSYLVSDRLVVSNAVIGTKVTDAAHQDYAEKNGFVFNVIAPYDGSGTERAYDRPTRLGPILPVNLDTASTTDDLVVVWYRFNRIGVAWASRPVQYSISWPSDSEVSRIVIASGQGSGPLFNASFPSRRVYNQPDPDQPGYNPNEEHALLQPSAEGAGEALFALRNDLNALLSPPASQAYALLKYRDPVTSEWCIKPFKIFADQPTVINGQGPFLFQYEGVAATEIAPPYPLSLLPLSPESHGQSGPFWEDYAGKLYARAAGAGGTTTNVVIRWFYPVQPGFFYDFNRDKTNDVPNGSSLAWLDRRPNAALASPNASQGNNGVPIDATYRIRWPVTPTLQIGESLMTPKRGLPGVKNMARVESIYDDLTPGWNPLTDPTPPIATLARLYDPLSTRTLTLDKTFKLSTALARINRAGKEVFTDLPYALRIRLLYDPINHALEFSGLLDELSYAGEPLLLPNVLSSRERDTLKQLASADVQWAGVVDKLYDLTRNPNGVDLEPRDSKPDQALRIGLTSQYAYRWVESVRNPETGESQDITRTGVTLQFPIPRAITGLSGYRLTATNVVIEPLGDLPKTLTAGLAGVPSPTTQPGQALLFNGATNSAVNLGDQTILASRPFTIEFWVLRSTRSAKRILVSQGTSAPRGSLAIGFTASDQLFFEFEQGNAAATLVSPAFTADADEWVHWACTYDPVENLRQIVRNGQRVAHDNPPGGAFLGSGNLVIGRDAAGARVADLNFVGLLDDFRVWNSARTDFGIRQDLAKRLTGDEPTLARYFRFDESNVGLALDGNPDGFHAPFEAGVTRLDSTAPTGMPPRYLTLVENNDPSLGALPVVLHIIRVDDGPFGGDLKPILPDNVFDQRLTFRHSSDFGGDPDRVLFEWYMKPDDAGFDPEDLPIVDRDGQIVDPRGWILYSNITPTDGRGVNDITIGTGGESGLITISDNWFIARYRGFNVGLRGPSVWSDWIGDPSGTIRPRAALGEGWVKRVIRGLNPFDARVKDFHAAPVNTFASMLVQAGQRYEGDIAFNPSADNLNSIGLIEAYQTVLNRARKLSIEGTPPVNFNPANNALLLASSRIADLYMLLGNEAYADAQDPTIGFGTTSLEYGSAASSIFSFQNQMDSLLDEELSLLRGRDDTFAGVGARPVYNRLFWNFTLGEGEVAYQQTYNINDQNFDGFLDEKDARILFPQGHGDAWGHYLTAIKSYYALLRHPKFTWVPRTERVNVAGVAQEVDFLDERKFAKAAAARARTGRETVDLTYRLEYVEDPDGQWQGYEDTRPDRAWGVTDWARRAGQGAYLDWLAANAILPSEETDPSKVGIRKIDRQTVNELGEITDQAREIQATLDKADLGLNPIGLAKGVVPFDLDPTFTEVGATATIGRRTVQGLTHFDQIMERAVKGLQNALRVFNEANRGTQNLRQNQDTVDDLTRNARSRELDYKNRLIEIFGYPYAGDIGAGKTYPSGYNGPDLYRYMYVDGEEITGRRFPPTTNYTAFFKPMAADATKRSFYVGAILSFEQDSVLDPQTVDTSILTVDFPISAADYGFTATDAMGKRRAPGELQQILSDLIQANGQFKIALQNYDGLIAEIRDQIALLEALEAFNLAKTALKGTQFAGVTAANIAIGIMRVIEVNLRGTAGLIRDVGDATMEGIPKVVGLATDVASPARALAKAIPAGSAFGMETVSDNLGLAQEIVGLGKEVLGLGTELGIEVASQRFEVLQAVAGIEALFRNEAATRIEVYKQAEAIRQIVGRYQATLAEGIRTQDELIRFRTETAADVTEARYQDMTFRIFRNDALQKYRAQFDLAARYVYLAATAYDYEINLLGDDPRAGADFLAQIVRQRSLGQVEDGEPVVGQPGLSDLLGRMIQNFDSVRGQFGFNNPQIEGNRFSLRKELFRIADDDPGNPNDASDLRWRAALRSGQSANGATAALVPDLWALPEFRRHCRPFAPELLGPQPGLVLKFPSTIQFGLNFFNLPLGGGDSAYDASRFATKIRSVGVWLSNYDGNGLSFTPRLYIVPTGADILRSPSQADDFRTREWRVIDQAIPVPFPIGNASLKDPFWIPEFDTLGGSFAAIRRHGGIRAFHDSGEEFDISEDRDQIVSDARLIGRSVWNTEWMIIIPGGTFLADPQQGLEDFIDSNTDIKVLLQTYSYSGL